MRQRTIPSILLSAAALTWACGRCPECPPCEACPPCPACEPCAEGSPKAPSTGWFVHHVIDGDTIVVTQDATGRRESVRLLYIDTPEKDEPGYEQAREALKSLVRSGEVVLDFGGKGVETRDSYGRLLAYIIVGNINANIEMVRQGWSPYYTKYGKGRFRREFEQAQNEAQKNRRGLWAAEKK